MTAPVLYALDIDAKASSRRLLRFKDRFSVSFFVPFRFQASRTCATHARAHALCDRPAMAPRPAAPCPLLGSPPSAALHTHTPSLPLPPSSPLSLPLLPKQDEPPKPSNPDVFLVDTEARPACARGMTD
jgi:hypothetical protein